jgi:hypothetical protein
MLPATVVMQHFEKVSGSTVSTFAKLFWLLLDHSTNLETLKLQQQQQQQQQQQ